MKQKPFMSLINDIGFHLDANEHNVAVPQSKNLLPDSTLLQGEKMREGKTTYKKGNNLVF
ncbi:MAG: hypothetical protein CV087_04910 [Candidatus Brocadia sp. WS118]|nr:MAG: hypothetical protein CV087_04910 [Candidatus Brocadia sp. WS118]